MRWWPPEEFDALGEFARALGFAHVESGPLVRSSYHARKGAAAVPQPVALTVGADVARVVERITPELTEFLEAQPVFFVATAPAGPEGHVNLSPKGYDTFRVLDEHTVAYLDLTGSGVETIAHLRENGRITLMFCAFEGRPNIVRLYGTGTVLELGTPEAAPLVDRFPTFPGARAVITVDVTRIPTSCGYAVPLMELVERPGPVARLGRPRRARRSSTSTAPRRTPRASTGCPDGSRRAARARVVAHAGPHDGARPSTWCCCRSAPTSRTSPGTRRCRSNDSRCWCSRATATRCSSSPSWKRPASRPSRGCSGSGRGPRPRTRSRSSPDCSAAAGSSGDRRPDLGAVRARDPAGAALGVPEPGVGVVGPLRMVKDAAEVEALRAAAHAVDAVAAEMRRARSAGGPRSTSAGSSSTGCSSTATSGSNFAIVAAGPNAASPHHDAGTRTIERRATSSCATSAARCDGYCSDITRMFVVGEPPTEVRDVYAVLVDAQERAVQAATVGMPCEAVDAAARDVITDGGFGDCFIHRAGHGIGLEAHEDPYLVAGNPAPLEPGHAFSIEPGIYFPGGTGCGSRTSWSRRPAVPTGSTPRPATSRSSTDPAGIREPRSRHGPAAVGHGRPGLLLVDRPP